MIGNELRYPLMKAASRPLPPFETEDFNVRCVSDSSHIFLKFPFEYLRKAYAFSLVVSEGKWC
jgi:hypothetical protein